MFDYASGASKDGAAGFLTPGNLTILTYIKSILMAKKIQLDWVKIDNLRKAAGIDSWASLCWEIGKNPRYINSVKNKGVNPSMSTVEDIAQLLGVSPFEIIKRND